MSRKWGIIFFIGLAFIICVQFVVIVGLLFSKGGMPALTKKHSIVVIEVKDVIMDSAKVLSRIGLYRDRDDVKGIVIRMETPGGSVAASQELSNAVARLRRDGKVVVTSVANLGASGGYYVACQSNSIVVNPGSLVGSIGVIMEHFDIHEMTDKLGIKSDAITSGAMKEAGTIFRPMLPEERALIKTVIDDAYSQFRGTVLSGRWNALARAAGAENGDSAQIEAQLDGVADGRILTGQQAVRAGLADELGDLDDAIEIAGELAGIEGEPHVIHDKPEEPWEEFGEMFGLANRIARRGPLAAVPPSGLWYLYH